MSIFAGFENGGNKTYENNPYITLSTYTRFLIPALKPDIDKSIFLDVDLIVLDDIKKMYDEDLKGYALGAVPEVGMHSSLYLKEKNTLNLNLQHAYFNAGVLLIDNAKWREENITQKLFEIDEQIRDVKMFKSQEPLNKCFDNNYKRLDLKYNVYDSTDKVNRDLKIYADISDEYVKSQMEEIVVRHFCGRNGKPWQNERIGGVVPIKNFDDFWKYMKMTPFHDEVRKQFEITNAQQLKTGVSLLRKNIRNKK
jgi:lipopolysaccharide biosynthesis glycosyltransferase